ncbi:MAG: hypothetical protein Q7S17_00900 [Xanthobacteraceae bacterium]|nr:hypothetical protein [Xanthobacteraceae bacterium]
MSEVRTSFHPHADGTFTIESVQDAEPIIENNKLLQTMPQKSDWGRHIASIPVIIMERWCKEDGVDYLGLPKEEFTRMIRRKLNDPDWKWLRTA